MAAKEKRKEDSLQHCALGSVYVTVRMFMFPILSFCDDVFNVLPVSVTTFVR